MSLVLFVVDAVEILNEDASTKSIPAGGLAEGLPAFVVIVFAAVPLNSTSKLLAT